MDDAIRFPVLFSLMLCLLLLPVNADSISGTFKAGNEYDLDNIMIKGSINDYAEIISPEDKEAMQSAMTDIIDDDSFNLIVFTVGGLDGKNIDHFAKELLVKKFGDVPDNMVLFVFSLDDRKYSFYLGRTVQSGMPKDFFSRLASSTIASYFSRGEYSKGMLNVVNKFHDAVLNGNDLAIPQETETDSEFSSKAVSFFKWAIIIFAISIVLLIVISNIFFVKRTGYGKNLSAITEHKDDEYFSAANLASALFARELEKSGNYKKEI